MKYSATTAALCIIVVYLPSHAHATRKPSLKGTTKNAASFAKATVHAAGGGSAIAQHFGQVYNFFHSQSGGEGDYRRAVDEDALLSREFGEVFARDFDEEDELVREFNEDLDLVLRNFEQNLAARYDQEADLYARDFDELDVRAFEEEFDMRNFYDEFELDAREFEVDELD